MNGQEYVNGRSKTEAAETEKGWIVVPTGGTPGAEGASPLSGTRSRALLPIGARLCSGRFTVMRRIGEGGMGVVYEVFDSERNTRVALKTLVRLEANDVYQLKNEFRGLADVTHPSLVRLHELFAEGDTWYFTMDLVDGVRFDEWVRPKTGEGEARPLDVARLRAAFLRMVEAVRAIHAAGKLHRDLKPSNVLVTPAGEVVVLDFGLAVDPELGGVGQTVADYSVSGTPAYMAPEQAAGEPARVASDYYALGTMLYEALAGRVPFEGPPHQVLERKRRDVVPPLRLYVEEPADLIELCSALLAREGGQRPDPDAVYAALGGELRVSGRPRTEPPRTAPRLVGRDAELAILRDAYRAALDGPKPVVVLLAGESGIGKSALVETFLDELRAQAHAVVLAGRCFERESVPFKGFDAIVDELSRFLRRLPAEFVSALLPRDASALRRLFPVLGRIGPIAEAPEREVSDPHELRRRAFAAFGELLGRLRDRQPVVLHLDDLQWSDADSTVLFLHLVRQPDAPKLLVIASHRSEQMHQHPCLTPLYEALPLDRRLDVRQLHVPPLSAEAARELLERKLANVPAVVAHGAGGNPFLLGELARHAAAHSGVAGDALSLRHVLRARIEALPAPERRLLELLAVSSRPVALSLAIAAAGGNQAPRTLFGVLRAESLARATGDGSLVECFHDQIREAVLDGLPLETKLAHHRALSNTLLARGDSDPEQIAVHLLGAGESARAAEQFLLAAVRAARELGFARAARLYEQAIAHGRFDPDHLHSLRVARADALAHAGRGLEAAEAYTLALEGATRSEAVELQLRAAEQCLYSGALKRGFDLQKLALGGLSIRVPGSTAATVASVIYHDARLWLRNHRRRSPKPSDPEISRRIDALRRAANATFRMNALRGVEFGLREASLALDHGTERDVAMASVNALLAALLLGKGTGAVATALDRADRLAGTSAEPEVLSWWLYGRGFARLYGPSYDPEGALSDFQRCIELNAEPVPRALSYNRGWLLWFSAAARVSMGELSIPASEVLPRLDDAWNRNDLSLVPMWAGWINGLTAIATGDFEVAEHALRKGRASWVSSEPTLQDQSLHEGEWLLHMYSGRVREAWICSVGWYQRLMRSVMGRSRWFMSDAALSLGLAAATLSRRTRSPEERKALLEQTDKMARAGGETHELLVRAALSCQLGDRASAIKALRAMPLEVTWGAGRLHSYAARRRLGVLLGGDEGTRLIQTADAFFRAGGVVDPERFTRTLLPGIEL